MRGRSVFRALAILATTVAASLPAANAASSVDEIVSVEAVKKRAALKTYDAARWDPIHFKPAIDKASDEACLVCHREVLDKKPRTASPSGLKASDAPLAWYQTLDTYGGAQEGFHWRHIQSPFARLVMNLSCNFCHQGNDPREEAPGSSATAGARSGDFTLRKMVNPSETCLRCHGAFPYQVMTGVKGPWPEVREDMEPKGTANGCLVCHERTVRTNRHKVTYLNAEAIETLSKKSSDVCYGCHGGRQWYRISYPYPRTPWPDMPKETPDWARSRPTQSQERFLSKRMDNQVTQP
jgi:hypothetical protein